MFGGKVTVSEENWDNVKLLAKKEVASVKQTKKLRQERDEAVKERDELKAKLEDVSSELAVYKKMEEEKHYLSHQKVKENIKQRSKYEQQREHLEKALAIIDTHGLRDEYERSIRRTTQRNNVLE